MGLKSKSAQPVSDLIKLGPRFSLGVGLLYFFGAIYWHLSHRGWFVDFKVYLEAAKKAHAGLTVYDVTTIDQFKYAPWVATCLGGLLSNLSFEVGAPVFAVAMALLWLGCVGEISRRTTSWAGALLCLYAHCFATDLVMGQINALTVALILLGYRGLERGQSRLTGIAWGLALQIKLYAAFLFPVLVFRRDWKTVRWTIICFVACNFGWVSLIHGGSYALSEFQRWIQTLSVSTSDLILNRDNISLLGVVGKWAVWLGFDQPWRTWTSRMIWGGVCTAYLTGAWSRRNAPVIFHSAWAMLGILVLNPLAWSYWLYFTAPALLIGVQGLIKNQNRIALVALVLVALHILTFIDHALVHRGGGVILAVLTGLLLLREFKVPDSLGQSSSKLEPDFDGTARA